MSCLILPWEQCFTQGLQKLVDTLEMLGTVNILKISELSFNENTVIVKLLWIKFGSLRSFIRTIDKDVGSCLVLCTKQCM